MTHPDPAVITDGLTKRFGDFVAVDHLDFCVESGSVVSLLGPNGAGKTTIVRMLATLSEPSSGTAVVCGYDVGREADSVRSVLSLTGQFAALEDNLTAGENLVLMARLRGYGKRGARRVVEQLIERFEIGGFRDRLVKSLSGGERRRVDLAGASRSPRCASRWRCAASAPRPRGSHLADGPSATSRVGILDQSGASP